MTNPGAAPHSKTVIVTGGAGGGIGGAIAAVMAEAGWNVVIVDLDIEAGQSLSGRLRRKGLAAAFLGADIVNADCAEKAVSFAMDSYGAVDALVNNAGVGMVQDITGVSDEDYRRIFDVNVDAAYRFSRAAVRAMPGSGGSIVNIGSVHALANITGYTVYAATKGAIDAFTRALAADCGPRGIRVNCIHPGLVPSPQNRELIQRLTSDVDAWLESYTYKRQLLANLPTGRQVGELVKFFLSDAAVAITGQSIAIDGGTSVMLYERCL
ncbi:MAG: SDR family oxidoreductase [Bryobacterales bacterium]|nr:SDR family oxidoreductase [Bryobacterales bacterium]